jgi:hypothetical protein
MHPDVEVLVRLVPPHEGVGEIINWARAEKRGESDFRPTTRSSSPSMERARSGSPKSGAVSV